MKRPIPILIGLALLSTMLQQACTHTAKPAQLADVALLIARNDSLRSELDAMDSASINHMSALFETERPEIELRFKDTLLKDEAEILGNYHQAMVTGLPALIMGQRLLFSRSDSARTRLVDLQHDMVQGSMKSADVSKAIEVEKAWAVHFEKQFIQLKQDAVDLREERERYRSAIDSLLRP